MVLLVRTVATRELVVKSLDTKELVDKLNSALKRFEECKNEI